MTCNRISEIQYIREFIPKENRCCLEILVMYIEDFRFVVAVEL